jgi:hypothetical protein
LRSPAHSRRCHLSAHQHRCSCTGWHTAGQVSSLAAYHCGVAAVGQSCYCQCTQPASQPASCK